MTVNALHPGAVRTALGQNNAAPLLKLLTGLFGASFRSAEAGADTEREPHRNARDDQAARRLGDESAKLTGLTV